MDSRTRQCVICDAPLSFAFSADRRVCEKPACGWKFASIPEERRCMVCSRELDVHQLRLRVCGNKTCQESHALVKHLAHRRKIDRKLREKANHARVAAAKRAGVSDFESYPVTITPAHIGRITKLPGERKVRMRERLEFIVRSFDEYVEHLANGTAQPREAPQPIPVLSPETARLMTTACTYCRGNCCRNGGEQAYISVDTLVNYTRQFPNAAGDDIVDAYMSHIPERTMTGSCIYHGDRGCTLPRNMRADICNRFYCGALTELQREIQHGAPVQAFLVPSNDAEFNKVLFATSELVQLVRYRSGPMIV